MSYNYYTSYEERQKQEQEEKKLTAKLNEIGYVNCPACRKKMLRVFAPKSGLKPSFKGDFKEFVKKMRRAQKAYENRGTKNINYLSGPEYTLVWNGSHFSRPFSDNLSISHGINHCSRGITVGSSAVDVAMRFLTGNKTIRHACIANQKTPSDLRAWLEQQDLDTLNKVIGTATIEEIPGTDLWCGTYAQRNYQAMTIPYEVEDVAGAEWAAWTDPIVADTPPHVASNYRHYYSRRNQVMAPTHGRVQYSNGGYRSDLAVELPAGFEWKSLAEKSWDRVINVETITGKQIKMLVSTEGPKAHGINNMTLEWHGAGFPRMFWVIQDYAVKGSDQIAPGDFVL